MALNLNVLIADFGAFYKAGSQNLKDLHQKLYRATKFDSLFTYVPTSDTVMRRVPTSSTELLQAFQKAFTPKGDLTMLPVEIPLFEVKADDQKQWDDLEATYVGFLTGEGLDRKEWPISRWFMEQIFLPQLMEDIEMKAFSAVYVAPTPGTAGPASAAFNGFKKYLQLRIAAGASIVYNTGALQTDPSDFVTQIEDWIALLPDDHRIRPGLTLAMNPTLVLRFKKGMRALYNQNYKQADLLTPVDFPNITISEQPSMIGSNKIFASFKQNLLNPVKRAGKEIMFESVDRSVKYWHDHWRAYGYVDDRLMFTNDLENS